MTKKEKWIQLEKRGCELKEPMVTLFNKTSTASKSFSLGFNYAFGQKYLKNKYYAKVLFKKNTSGFENKISLGIIFLEDCSEDNLYTIAHEKKSKGARHKTVRIWKLQAMLDIPNLFGHLQRFTPEIEEYNGQQMFIIRFFIPKNYILDGVEDKTNEEKR